MMIPPAAAAVIRFAPVDQPDVMTLAEAIHAEPHVGADRCRSIVVRHGRTYSQGECCQSNERAVLSGDIADLI